MKNLAIITGHVGADPDITNYEGGSIAVFSIATSEKYKNKAGEKVEKTEWHRIKCFGKLAEVTEKYIKKGNLINVVGKISTEKYDDKDGVTRYSTYILPIPTGLNMLGGKSDLDNVKGPKKVDGPNNPPEQALAVDKDDDLPF